MRIAFSALTVALLLAGPPARAKPHHGKHHRSASKRTESPDGGQAPTAPPATRPAPPPAAPPAVLAPPEPTSQGAATPAPAPPASPNPPPPATAQTHALAPDAFDFDLLGQPPGGASAAKPVVDPAFDAKVRLRRRMLVAHQVFGVMTLAGLAATLVVGQLNFTDKFAGGLDGKGYSGDYHAPHVGLAIGTSALFLITGALAVFAPEPYEKRTRLDTAFAHKLFMALATAGMVAAAALGIVSNRLEGRLVQRDIAIVHQVIGYATFGFMGIGVVAYMF